MAAKARGLMPCLVAKAIQVLSSSQVPPLVLHLAPLTAPRDAILKRESVLNESFWRLQAMVAEQRAPRSVATAVGGRAL